MLKTKPIYAPAEPGDGQRVLVTRFYPRGVKRGHFDVWIRELAPSAELLRLYKQHRINPADYAIEYQIQIDNDRARQALRKIKQDADTGNVTLLCYEPEGQFCHRCILKKLIRSGRFKPEDANHYLCGPVI